MEYSSVPFLAVAVICVSFSVQSRAQTNCSTYNRTLGPYPYGSMDAQEHITGDHAFANGMSGSCTYAGTASAYGPVGCSVTATANSTSGASDDGTLANPLKTHYTNYKDAQGLATAGNGNGAAADAEGSCRCSVLHHFMQHDNWNYRRWGGRWIHCYVFTKSPLE